MEHFPRWYSFELFTLSFSTRTPIKFPIEADQFHLPPPIITLPTIMIPGKTIRLQGKGALLPHALSRSPAMQTKTLCPRKQRPGIRFAILHADSCSRLHSNSRGRLAFFFPPLLDVRTRHGRSSRVCWPVFVQDVYRNARTRLVIEFRGVLPSELCIDIAFSGFEGVRNFLGETIGFSRVEYLWGEFYVGIMSGEL